MSKNYLGIDIGGTDAKFGIVDEFGHITCKSKYSVSFDKYKTPILTTVLTSTEKFLFENDYTAESLDGIGISATGQIDSKKGMVVGSGGNLKRWDGSRIKNVFESKYKLHVSVINDANCVALGEKWIGGAKNSKNIIVLTIGTGLGGGIIVNNEILLGQNGFAGEIGHFSINNHGVLCTCGNRGCFEQYASMTALVKDVTAYYQKNNADYLTTTPVNGKTIFQQIENQNEDIISIVDEWISNISSGIVSLIHIFNPDQIIIGGGVSAQKSLFVDKLRMSVFHKMMPNFKKSLSFDAAILGNDAGLVGAVYYLTTTFT
ncbi:MAG: ROK family protein [Suipraeoptans sp.]